MRTFFAVISLLLLSLGARAVEPGYLADLGTWQEIAVPAESDRGARAVWEYASNYSANEWRVFTVDGRPNATLGNRSREYRSRQPGFVPRAGGFKGGYAFAVDDGWLVGFNRGEFGSALYWFSPDGRVSRKISDHQIVDFFVQADGIYAIEGLAHLGYSRGSVIRLARSISDAYWSATPVLALPSAPYAVSVSADGTAWITLSNSLVLLQPDGTLQTVLRHAPWERLYPGSSALSQNEQKLYIGMRQFVGEFDLKTKQLRLLVPSQDFLNKLPKKEEERIRKQFAG